MPDPPPLKPLHLDSSLSSAKLAKLDLVSTDQLKDSLLPGKINSLKARGDGTLLDGHHRIFVLRQRGINVDLLPPEIVKGETDPL